MSLAGYPKWVDKGIVTAEWYFISSIYSRLSRCCTARGPVSSYYQVVPPRWGLVSSVLQIWAKKYWKNCRALVACFQVWCPVTQLLLRLRPTLALNTKSFWTNTNSSSNKNNLTVRSVSVFLGGGSKSGKDRIPVWGTEAYLTQNYRHTFTLLIISWHFSGIRSQSKSFSSPIFFFSLNWEILLLSLSIETGVLRSRKRETFGFEALRKRIIDMARFSSNLRKYLHLKWCSFVPLNT